MQNENTILQLRQLLLHSLMENEFYDMAADEIIDPRLKSAFAKYQWLRCEHILSLRAFLISIEGKVAMEAAKTYQNTHFWDNFNKCMAQRDSLEALTTGIRYLRFILHKYRQTIGTAQPDRLSQMLRKHHTEIEAVLDDFLKISEIRRNSQLTID